MNNAYSNEYDYDKLKGRKKEIKVKEAVRKQRPKKSDYTKLCSLLRDFGINIKLNDIPEFDNYKDMEIWKTKQIDNFLNNYNEHQEHIDNNILNNQSSIYNSPTFFAKTNKPKENKEAIDWSEFHF